MYAKYGIWKRHYTPITHYAVFSSGAIFSSIILFFIYFSFNSIFLLYSKLNFNEIKTRHKTSLTNLTKSSHSTSTSNGFIPLPRNFHTPYCRISPRYHSIKLRHNFALGLWPSNPSVLHLSNTATRFLLSISSPEIS